MVAVLVKQLILGPSWTIKPSHPSAGIEPDQTVPITKYNPEVMTDARNEDAIAVTPTTAPSVHHRSSFERWTDRLVRLAA